MRVKILYSNTHAGQGLREGGLLRTAVKVDPDIIAVVEVQRPSARLRLRRQFPKDKWGIHGLKPPALSAAAPGNHVLWRKDAFIFANGERDRISRQVWRNGIRDKWHPSRHENMTYLDSVVSKKRIAVGCDHLWTTAGHSWALPFDNIVRGHVRQATRVADAAGRAQDENYPVVNVGDYNEVIDETPRLAFVEVQMRRNHMQRFSKNEVHHLDAAFASRDAEVYDFWWIPEHQLTTDHPGFVLVVDI